jgi:N-acetylglucosamine PTS system EIICBA or EIICB component
LIPIGIAYFLLYYAVFRVCIVRLNLSTPGREADDTTAQASEAANIGTRGRSFLDALGGAGNLTEVSACTTRLRLSLVNNRAIDEPTLVRLGSRGLLRSANMGLQVVLGPIADQVAGEIRDAMRGTPPQHAVRDTSSVADAAAMLAALGGRHNVGEIECHAGRVLVRIADAKKVDEPALRGLGIRGVAHSAAGSMQLLIAGSAEDWAQPLRRLL